METGRGGEKAGAVGGAEPPRRTQHIKADAVQVHLSVATAVRPWHFAIRTARACLEHPLTQGDRLRGGYGHAAPCDPRRPSDRQMAQVVVRTNAFALLKLVMHVNSEPKDHDFALCIPPL